MQQVKIYTASPSDLSPPVQSESFCVDLVLASDYRELEAKCAALVVENGALKKSEVEFNDYCRHECEDVGDTWVDDFTETPATDEFLAEVRAQAHKEGAHFVANRMLAAWDAGFIDDTAKNAADIARMILTSTEFMADAPEGDFDRSFADGVLEGIAAQLRKGVQS
ncbi:ead/Ea22-like family protein [Salmonella enterica subsp. enterica serovar Braenderup]|uniref:Ead/Ea22-like family protein n=1 Tax=Salmonella enterica subsp. houtenae serovar 45:g,z51:- TaxID=1967611 RepID=A0A701UIA7_SALHO|nr:ead/Ea22-like family protein [Salmonella enterica subsp. houtenae]EHP9584337.1 ead/Ea22-like family protein [Salmonella enterica subsp. houtenae serovar 50:g,z51:-]EIQ1566488.1 ead/Ea22-like family protein [Salmonella enterica]EJU1822029.1 ead/Ea22-like family protein [Salmonella enterica subsp. enterica serovar Braenderup]HAC6521294.1 ead/Ea22-like family protein [Salmonella enterica subsp. houtenae serovar 45:g,z51:-]HAE4739345.1 ead/Ea22-like family protein [Salmonella enterica subsp. ho